MFGPINANIIFNRYARPRLRQPSPKTFRPLLGLRSLNNLIKMRLREREIS
jgi:hypothetical protein